MIDPISAIADLRERWHTLKDPDRALAILPIIQAGVSRHRLASALNCSPSLIRHRLDMLLASPEDQELARRGMISSNEVVRRGRENCARCEARRQIMAQQRREEAAERGCRGILNWLAEDDLRTGSAEQIVEEARRRMIWTEEGGQLPRGTAPVGMPLAEIIARCRPERNPDELDVSFNAKWLARWIFYRIADWNVRWAALDRALGQVSSRFWLREL